MNEVRLILKAECDGIIRNQHQEDTLFVFLKLKKSEPQHFQEFWNVQINKKCLPTDDRAFSQNNCQKISSKSHQKICRMMLALPNKSSPQFYWVMKTTKTHICYWFRTLCCFADHLAFCFKQTTSFPECFFVYFVRSSPSR